MYGRSDEESDELKEILPLSWDADKDVPDKDWGRLFEAVTAVL